MSEPKSNQSATETDACAQAAPPALGLALGGGVARGWAHIGVVRRLDELGVKPDIVCATSIGALVGGCWLAGSLDALEDWARDLTKARMLTYFDVMLNGSGLMGGKRLERKLRRNLPPTKIEDLPQKFLAVTAELATGHEIWLTEGDLGEAILAAYALPGVFPPRALGGRWLIDGALVNPLPISACRASGARVVLAVGLHADAFSLGIAQRRDRFQLLDQPSGEKLRPSLQGGAFEKLIMRQLFRPQETSPGLGSVMVASFNILMDRITRSRMAGDPADVLMLPEVGHVPLLDFDRADELIDLGRAAVDRHMPELESALECLA
ncbi:MAG: patatin-like phospholipase family protein [Pseudomonadota bacterium]